MMLERILLSETFEDTDALSGCGAAVPRAPFESIQL